jgi:hypothetical protein
VIGQIDFEARQVLAQTHAQPGPQLSGCQDFYLKTALTLATSLEI